MFLKEFDYICIMRNSTINILALFAVLIMSFACYPANAQEESFVNGLEEGYTFSADKYGQSAASISFTNSGKTYKVMTFYYNGSTVTAVETDSGNRSILFMNGKPNMATASGKAFPQIGFKDGKEAASNEYAVGPHDFTGDGQPELVLAVRSASGNGLGIYIFGPAGSGWKCLGEMVTTGYNIRFCRVFRQTVTIKNADNGTLYTWTWHDGHFDFLSSDKVNNPDILLK